MTCGLTYFLMPSRLTPVYEKRKLIKKPTEIGVEFDGKCLFYDGDKYEVQVRYYLLKPDDDVNGWYVYRNIEYGTYWLAENGEILGEITKEEPAIEDNDWMDKYSRSTWTVTASPTTYVTTSTAWVNRGNIDGRRVYPPTWYYTTNEVD